MLIRIYFTIQYLYEVLNIFVINVQFLKYSLYVCINHIRVARIIKTRFIATTNNLNKKKPLANPGGSTSINLDCCIVRFLRSMENAYILAAVVSVSSNKHTLEVTIAGFTVSET